MNTSKTLTAALVLLGLPMLASAATLTVTVDEIETPRGSINLGVFDEAGYESGVAVGGDNVTVEGDSITVTVEGLAPGEYGIKLYHDVDGDGEMSTNPFGMPTEPYAFSNNAKGRFGPATWTAAKFSVSEDGTSHAISLK